MKANQKTTVTNLSLLFVLLSFCAGCADNRDKTQDPISGKLTTRNCMNPLSGTDSFKGDIDFTGSTGFVTLNTSVPKGSSRILHLYNETTCASRLDTDYVGDTDTYLMTASDAPRTGLYVQSGDNKIDFTVEECASIDIDQNYKCVDQIATDSGYFIVHVK